MLFSEKIKVKNMIHAMNRIPEKYHSKVSHKGMLLNCLPENLSYQKMVVQKRTHLFGFYLEFFEI